MNFLSFHIDPTHFQIDADGLIDLESEKDQLFVISDRSNSPSDPEGQSERSTMKE
jgi:hypothetical protein